MNYMNNVIFSFLLLFTVSVAVAQNSAVTNAILYHKDNTLDKAKQEIDQAVLNDKTKGEPKAWYYKGVIYTDISRSTKPEVKALSANPLKDAYEAFNTSMKLDAAKGEFYKMSESKLKELWSDVINKGIGDYESENLKEALVSFEMAQAMRPTDTTAFIYGSYAAEGLSNDAKLRTFTNELVKLNYKSPYVYRNRIYLEGDAVKKLELAKQANTEYAKDEALTEILGDTYAEQGKNQDALNTYIILNGLMPQNITVLTKMAVQYEKLKKQDEALDLYNKIISLDKLNFIANYNAAVIHFEKAKAEDQQKSKLNVDELHTKGKQMEEEINKHFNTSLQLANVALNQTTEEDDIKNIKLMISEINKVMKK